MSAFLARRAAFALVLVLVVPPSVFLLSALAPGDSADEAVLSGARAEEVTRERVRLGLDRPLGARLASWVGRAARFDLGTSFKYQQPVLPLVVDRAANTALLGATALLVATLVGVPLGVVAAGSRWRAARLGVSAISTAMISLPPLVLALLLAYAAARTGWFPVGGMRDVEGCSLVARAVDLTWHLVVPVVALALPLAARLERLQARALAQSLGEPFVRAAAARGISRTRLLWAHAFPHAIVPVVSIYGLVAASLLSGSLAVEIVTAWPGLGRLTYDALVARDSPLAAGCAAAGAVLLAMATLASDVALAFVEPRLRVQGVTG